MADPKITPKVTAADEAPVPTVSDEAPSPRAVKAASKMVISAEPLPEPEAPKPYMSPRTLAEIEAGKASIARG
jgi:hypothetical protein